MGGSRRGSDPSAAPHPTGHRPIAGPVSFVPVVEMRPAVPQPRGPTGTALMDELWHILRSALGPDLREFLDLDGLIRVVGRLVLAALLGGVLGVERTIRRRPAGMRTYMLVGLGSAAFLSVPEQIGFEAGDLSRVIQGLMAGIGFLGAGVIFRSGDDRSQARGLTTAAGIWLTAAVGMACGLGRPATAALVTALGFVILSPLLRLEGKIERTHPAPEGPPEPESRT